jgi:hypothetical protein
MVAVEECTDLLASEFFGITVAAKVPWRDESHTFAQCTGGFVVVGTACALTAKIALRAASRNRSVI